MKNDTNLTFINNIIKNSHAESCGGLGLFKFNSLAFFKSNILDNCTTTINSGGFLIN